MDLRSKLLTAFLLMAGCTTPAYAIDYSYNGGDFQAMFREAQGLGGSDAIHDIGIAHRMTVETSPARHYGFASLIETTVPGDGANMNHAVAVYGQGLVKGLGGNAWGANFVGQIQPGFGASGSQATGMEADAVNNSGVDLTDIATTALYGITIWHAGDHQSTAAIFTSKNPGSAGFHYGWFIGNNAIAPDGVVMTVGADVRTRIGIDLSQATYTEAALKLPPGVPGVLCIDAQGQVYRGASSASCDGAVSTPPPPAQHNNDGGVTWNDGGRSNTFGRWKR